MKKIMSAFAVCGALVLGACGDGKSGAQNGDTVVIDFAGYLDGVQFPGGTASGFPLRLGSGQFVPGFEDQLIGVEKGDVRDVKITFPTNYVPDLAGKKAVFKVTVVDVIKETASVEPENNEPTPMEPTPVQE